MLVWGISRDRARGSVQVLRILGECLKQRGKCAKPLNRPGKTLAPEDKKQFSRRARRVLQRMALHSNRVTDGGGIPVELRSDEIIRMNRFQIEALENCIGEIL